MEKTVLQTLISRMSEYRPNATVKVSEMIDILNSNLEAEKLQIIEAASDGCYEESCTRKDGAEYFKRTFTDELKVYDLEVKGVSFKVTKEQARELAPILIGLLEIEK